VIRVVAFILLVAALIAVALTFRGISTEGQLDQHHRGVALIEQHRFIDAEAVLLALVEQSPEAFVPRFNLAVAQLNQAEEGVARALVTLGEARRLDPTDPRVPYALGVIHRFQGNEDLALAEFRRAVELAPRDADANYQVGISLTHLGEATQALPFFEITVRLDPTILGAWNNLQLIHRREGRVEDADRALAEFQKLRDSGRGRAHSTKYTEQGDLSLAIRDWPASRPGLGVGAAIRLAPPRWLSPEPPAPPEFFSAALVDLDLDCRPDLWIAGPGGAIWSFAGDEPRAHPLPGPLLAARTFAVGDLDEDGVPDLVTAAGRFVIVFSAAGVPAPLLQERQRLDVSMLPPVRELRLVDLDLEGDLDLLIVPQAGAPWIALNEGRTLRAPGDPALPWAGEPPRETRIAFARDLDGDSDADFGLHGAASPHFRIIENAPEWRFALDPEGIVPAGAAASAPAAALVEDLDGDTRDDLLLIAAGAGGPERFRIAPGGTRFFGELVPLSIDLARSAGSDANETAPAATGAVSATALADLDLDGSLDLVISTEGAESLLPAGSAPSIAHSALRNDGTGRFERAAGSFGAPAAALLAGDLDGDLDPDLIAITAAGTPLFIRNDTDRGSAGHNAVRLYLGGRRDGTDRRTNLLGYGTRVEVRAGDLRVARTFEGAIGHRAQGLAPLVIGIGARPRVDWLYLAWPDGVTQAEMEVPLDACHTVEEVQRKSSSCPVLFTWDGDRYRFITDFMGGGGLGFWVGPGEFAPPDPTEVVRIEPGALEAIEGELRLSVMEPMQEVATIDRLELLAVDHPPGTEVYPLERFPVAGEPPSGAPLLLRRRDRCFPTELRGDRALLDPALVAEVDREYAEPAGLDPDLVGYAARSRWTVTFGRTPPRRSASGVGVEGSGVGTNGTNGTNGANGTNGGSGGSGGSGTNGTNAVAAAAPLRTYLFLDGWVEYPYSRINFAASQRALRLEAPTISWDRGDGDWRLLGEEIGYPAGMPKTMVLDVTEAVDGGASRFRIETNLELFIDRIFLAPAVELTVNGAGGALSPGTGSATATGTGSGRTRPVPVPSPAIAASGEDTGSLASAIARVDTEGLGSGNEEERDAASGAFSRSLPLLSAELRFGGYPREYSDDGKLPATYHYEERDPTLDYRPMGGLLTRYGRVDELITAVDDRFALVGGGDELLLAYDATDLPELPDGWRRTYLLDTHGYCKDRDPLTAERHSVEPLPWGAMSAYPPPAGEREPDRGEYRRLWNTRGD